MCFDWLQVCRKGGSVRVKSWKIRTMSFRALAAPVSSLVVASHTGTWATFLMEQLTPCFQAADQQGSELFPYFSITSLYFCFALMPEQAQRAAHRTSGPFLIVCVCVRACQSVHVEVEGNLGGQFLPSPWCETESLRCCVYQASWPMSLFCWRSPKVTDIC